MRVALSPRRGTSGARVRQGKLALRGGDDADDVRVGDEALDVRAERIGSVIWTTGFGPDLEWLHLPVRGADGSLAHTCGITALPGLYVVGYPWLSTRGSGILYGVDADACRIAQHIAAALRHASPSTDRRVRNIQYAEVGER